MVAGSANFTRFDETTHRLNKARTNKSSLGMIETQNRLKLYSSVIHCETGLPSFSAGKNLMLRAASIAASVIPSFNSWITIMFIMASELIRMKI